MTPVFSFVTTRTIDAKDVNDRVTDEWTICFTRTRRIHHKPGRAVGVEVIRAVDVGRRANLLAQGELLVSRLLRGVGED